MKCPRCKSEVSPNDLVCPSCKLKLMIACPRCKSLSRLGSSLCQNCGFVFVKFCPKCNSANYASATHCRKCFYELPSIEGNDKEIPKELIKDDISKIKEEIKKEVVKKEDLKKEEEVKKPISIIKPIDKKILQSNPAKEIAKDSVKEKIQNVTPKLVVLIDFISINSIFEKYKDEEFKQKVLLNIKAAVRIGFNADCEFIKPNIAIFKTNYIRKIGILSKIEKFKEEITKFNGILAEILDTNITYKFAITTEGEYKNEGDIKQLEYGIDKDIITSNGAYKILSDEINLIKISNNSYKMVFLDEKPAFNHAETTTADEAIDLIQNAVTDEKSEIKAISVNAPRGFGKTHMLETLQERLEEKGTITLLGQCTPLTQVTPMGLFQDIFLSLFRLTFAPSKYEEKVNIVREYLTKNLPENVSKNSTIIDTLINVIYPTKEDYYENILANKQKTFEDLKTLFELLRDENKLLLVIDDFDLIDECSFDFLKYLIQNNFFDDSKLMLLYKNQHTVETYIHSEKLPQNVCLNINLSAKSSAEIQEYIKNKFKLDNKIPDEIVKQAIVCAQGNFAYVEQFMHHLVDERIITNENGTYHFNDDHKDDCIPKTFDEIMDKRYEHLRLNYPLEYKILSLASMLGGKFSQSVLLNVLHVDEDTFTKSINKLIDKGFIKKTSLNLYIFKNNLIWSHIYDKTKNNEELIELQKEFLDEICKRTISSPAIKALLAQSVQDNNLAFNLWTQNLKYASYVGDTNLYILSQKQSLSLLESSMATNQAYIKNNICERVGKLIYEKKPKDAINYLANAISCAREKGQENKIIELSGYLIQSCKLAQNYFGIIEAVDDILNIYSEPKNTLERALIKTRKLYALLRIGNWGEIASIVNDEINPVIQEYLKHPKNTDYVTSSDIYKMWLSANVTLANSYAQQGNSLTFTMIDELEKEIFKEKNKDVDLANIKLNLALTTALAYTIKGATKISNEILQSIIKDYSYIIDNPITVSDWNYINVLNKILNQDFENIKDDLFEFTAYANNNGDEYNKNLLKTMLALVLTKEGNNLKALEICEQEAEHFTNTQKSALGALLCWYIEGVAILKTDVDKCIKICEKAIKICKDTKINSILFNILFNKVLAEAYLLNGDVESAKMYTELAIQEAVAQENDILEVDLLLLRAKCLEETLNIVDKEKQNPIMQKIVQIYEKAINTASRIGSSKKHYDAQKALTAFKANCQLKEIE